MRYYSLLLAVFLAHGSLAYGMSRVAGTVEDDPLTVADLIVRGVVESTSPALVEVPVRAMTAHVRVLELIRGSYRQQRIALVTTIDMRSLRPGREYVICAVRHESKNRWFTNSYFGIYRRSGNEWIRHVTPEFDVAPDTLTSPELRARIHAGSLEAVTRRSDVILMGQVTAVRYDSLFSPDEGLRHVRHYELRVNEVLKGNTDRVEFVVPMRHRYPTVEVGQQWLVFLQMRDFGLYPFAGLNSMLEIRGDQVIYNSVVPCPGTRSEILHRVRRYAHLAKLQ